MTITAIRKAFVDALDADLPGRTVTSDRPEATTLGSTVLVRVSQEAVRVGDLELLDGGPLTMDAQIVVSFAETTHDGAEGMVSTAINTFDGLRDGERTDGVSFPASVLGGYYVGFAATEDVEGVQPARFYNATFIVTYNRLED